MLKPSIRRLIEVIKCTLKSAYMSWRIGNTFRWLHVYNLREITIQEGILDVHLIKRPLADCCGNYKGTNESHFGDMSKSFLIIDPILLCEATCNQPGLYRSTE